MPRFRLISDAPAGTDSFSSHRPVAEAIATLIETEQERGKAVGLSGSWGSGKSTIIEILREKLRADPGARIFMFDAWAHQGDPLRRAFLDSLARDLGRAPYWIDYDAWRDRLDFLTGRKAKTETVVERRLTFWGALVAILLIACLPLGLAIASRYSISTGDEGHSRKFFQIGIAVFLLPFAAAILAWISQRPTARFWRAAFWTGSRTADGSSLLRLLVKEAGERTITTSSKTLDPTSVEFRDAFMAMLDEALDATHAPPRRLVIVIDNLDRVDPQDAGVIWSTMRIFFEVDAHRPSAWAPRLWLVVPFDRDALKRLWKTDRSTDPDEAGRLVDAFVNKTFQVVFDVAPPVVLHRMTYFGDRYKEAFPDDDAQQHGNAIYALYDRLGPSSPSPREIKLFLNRLGARYVQGDPAIPLPLVALYQLTASKISAGAQELLQPEFLEARTLALLSDDAWRANWRAYLAAVHFNLPPDQALHVLNGGAIAEALESGDPAQLAPRLKEEGFWSICDRVIWERYGAWKAAPILLTNAARVLAEPLAAVDRPQAEKVWTALEAIAVAVEDWGKIDEDSALGAVGLLKRMQGRNARYRHVCDLLLQAVGALPNIGDSVDDDALAAVRTWFRGASLIFRHLDAATETRESVEEWRATRSPGRWVALQLALFHCGADPAFATRIQCTSPGEIPNALFAHMRNAAFTGEIVRFAPRVRTTYAGLPWSTLDDSFRVVFANAEPPEEGAILRSALALTPSASPGFFLAGSILWDAFEGFEQDSPSAAALCLVPLCEMALVADIGVKDGLAVRGALDRVADGSPATLHFAGALLDLERIDLLRSAAGVSSVHRLVSTALHAIASHNAAAAAGRFTPTFLAVAFHLFPEAGLERLLPSWLERPDAVPFLSDRENFRVEHERLFVHVLRSGDFRGKAGLVSALVGLLRALSTPEWLSAITRPDFEALVEELSQSAGPAWIPIEVADAWMQAMPSGEELAHGE